MARTVHTRYVRHRHYNRLRHSQNLRGFLVAQAARLQMTEEEVFDLFKAGNTWEQIAGMEAPPPAEAPVNTVAPVASGTPVQGEVLSVTDGTWTGTPAPTFTYQWQRDAADIADATANSYTLVAGDVGATITCIVTGTNSAGSASATSNGLGPVTAP